MTIQIGYRHEPHNGKIYNGLCVWEPRWLGVMDYKHADIVQTCSPRCEDMIADRVGVSGPNNRGASRTLIRADDDEVVLTLTSGHPSFRYAMLAYLSPQKAVQLGANLIRAAKDAGFKWEDE